MYLLKIVRCRFESVFSKPRLYGAWWHLWTHCHHREVSGSPYASVWLAGLSLEACCDSDGIIHCLGFFFPNSKYCTSMMNCILPKSSAWLPGLWLMTPQPTTTGVGWPREIFYRPTPIPANPIPVNPYGYWYPWASLTSSFLEHSETFLVYKLRKKPPKLLLNQIKLYKSLNLSKSNKIASC